MLRRDQNGETIFRLGGVLLRCSKKEDKTFQKKKDFFLEEGGALFLRSLTTYVRGRKTQSVFRGGGGPGEVFRVEKIGVLVEKKGKILI